MATYQASTILQPNAGTAVNPMDPVSKVLSGLQVAVARQKKGTATKGDLANIAYAQKTYGFDPATMTLKKGPNTKTPIPADQLGVGDPYKQISDILGANVTPDMLSSDVAGILALNGTNSKEKQQYDELTGQLVDLNKQLGGQAADLQTEMDKQGVGTAYQQMKELNLKAAQLQGEIGAFDAETEKINANLGEQAIPTGLIQGQQAQLNQQRTLAHNAKVAELSAVTALSQAYQGNAQLGLDLAQKAVDLKYAPMLQQIETLKTQIGFAKENMTAADAKRADIINAIADERKARLDEQKATESDISKLAIEAAGNGAPMSVITAMKKAKTIEEAAVIGQQYAHAPKTSTRGSGGSDVGSNYVNLTKTTDAGGGLAFFGKNKKTGKQEPIGAAVYSVQKGIPLDQILGTSKNKADIELVKEIKKARAQGDSDETILNDLYNSGKFNHLFVGF